LTFLLASNETLAKQVAEYLDIPLGVANVRRFADQEIFVEILENVRGEDCFVLQSTSFPQDKIENLAPARLFLQSLLLT